MNTRRSFLAAGSALAALSTVSAAKTEQRVTSLYIHGMVWNQQLPTPMSDWLVRLDAKVNVPLGNDPQVPSPGFATLGDDKHDGAGSHATVQTATLKGDQLTVVGTITESKTAGLVGQSFRLEGKVVGAAVQGLTVTIGDNVFTGAGLLVVIAIIAILIAL